MQKITKAAIYCRTATSDADISVQKKAAENYCKKHNIEIINVYSDIGISGLSPIGERPAILTMLSESNVDVIVVSNISRLSRNVFDLCRFLSTHNVVFAKGKEVT